MREEMNRGVFLFVIAMGLAGCSAEEPQWGSEGGSELLDPEDGERTLSGADVAAFQRDGDWLILPSIAIPGGASRAGILAGLRAEGPLPPMEARLLVDDAAVTDWAALTTTWSEVDHHVAVADFGTVGSAVQLRVHVDALDALDFLRWNAVLPGSTSSGGKADDGGYGTMIAPLRTELLGLGIVTREAWGARSSSCSSNPYKNRVTIHHTETPSTDPARQVRGIQNYHMDTRGWCDVGYHFLIGVDGTIYEGRPLEKLGAHTGGQNTNNIGIAFIGCFHPGCSWGPTSPPEAAIQAAGRLLATLSDIYGFDVSASAVKGHRDMPGASTDCPGDNLEARIGDIIEIGRSGVVPEVPETPAEPDPTLPGECGSLTCSSCVGTVSCGWCASMGGCVDSDGVCAWGGRVGSESCWTQLWPCATATCWNPTKTVPACGTTGWDEDFSSGRYSVHRYWTSLPAGGPVTVRLERTGGTFSPAILVADRGGRLAYGGDVAGLHPDIAVRGAVSGKSGSAAEVTIEATRNTDIYLYVTGWSVLDTAFGGTVPTSSRYRVSITQDCGGHDGGGTDGGAYGTLTQGGSQIPRAGLYNATLSFLGTTTEPYGDLVTDGGGNSWVRGSASWFGGPSDTGVSSSETGAITGEILRDLNDPLSPSASTLASRPGDYYYVAMRWSYSPNGRSWWADALIVVRNPATGAEVVVRPVDWGPNISTGRIIDLSPQAMNDLGLTTDDDVWVAFAGPGSALGPVH
jgi:hypothetical protein